MGAGVSHPAREISRGRPGILRSDAMVSQDRPLRILPVRWRSPDYTMRHHGAARIFREAQKTSSPVWSSRAPLALSGYWSRKVLRWAE